MSGTKLEVNQTESIITAQVMSQQDSSAKDTGLYQEYRTYCYRWVVLLVYAAIVSANQMSFTSYAPLYDPLVTGFGVKEIWIVLLQTMPHVSFVPMSFVVSLMFRKLRAITVYRCAPVIMLIGCWLRMLAFVGNDPFWVLISANTFSTLATPIFLNGLSRVVVSWFREREHAKATSLVSIGATLGGLLGNAIPGFYAVNLDKTDPAADLKVIKECIYAQNYIITLVSVFFLILFRAKPQTPPSQLADETTQKDTQNKGQRNAILSALCKNMSFVCNCIIFVVGFGTLTSIPVFFSNLFKPGSYSVRGLSLISAFSVIGGMFGSPIAGVILDKTQAYLYMSRLQTFMALVAQIAAIWVIPAGNLPLACFWCFCIGFWFSICFPCCLNYSVLLTHPIPSDAANGIMLASSFVFSSIFGIVEARFFEKNWNIGMSVLIGALAVPFFASVRDEIRKSINQFLLLLQWENQKTHSRRSKAIWMTWKVSKSPQAQIVQSRAMIEAIDLKTFDTLQSWCRSDSKYLVDPIWRICRLVLLPSRTFVLLPSL